VCSKQDLLSLFEGLQIGIFGFHRKKLEPKVAPWQQHRRCHSVSFVVHICGAGFEERCSDISGDILD